MNRILKQLAFGVLIVVVLAAAVYVFVLPRLSIQQTIREPNALDRIKLPPGFTISVYADNLNGELITSPGPNNGPRLLQFYEGILYASMTAQGRVIALPDRNGDGIPDSIVTFLDGLNKPHGIDAADGWFYIAEEHRVFRVRDDDHDLHADNATIQTLMELPADGGHFTRTLRIQDDTLFVSIGSSCDVCHETDERRASIFRCTLNGSSCEKFAGGIRNAVGLAIQQTSGRLFATENGRDWLGDDLPPDEINIINEDKNYGWPVCYGKNIHDRVFDTSVIPPCSATQASAIDLQAHSAPLGLTFYTGNQFPSIYQGLLFVAYHGSWNRGQPTGYKIVAINTQTNAISDFATGWLQPNGVLGRPVDVAVAPDGSLFVSDDNAGRIYRISYRG